MKIQEIMTPDPIWCISHDTSVQAAYVMKEMNIGSLPVVKSASDHRVVGVVTDRDLCLAVIAMNQLPSAVQVQQCMARNIVACHLNDEVQRAADLMRENQVHRIPVVDSQGMLQGMVSTADIFQRSDLSSNITHRTLKKVTEATADASKPRANMAQAA